jgi:KDO2-lipid IV(A) lauroyltransferase
MKKGRMLGLVADQDGGYHGIFVPFLGKMASTPTGPVYFARKFKAPIIPMFIVRKENYYGHQAIVEDPIYYEDTGDQKADDYNATLKITQAVLRRSSKNIRTAGYGSSIAGIHRIQCLKRS